MSANLNATLNGTQISSCAYPASEGKRIGYTLAYSLMFCVCLVANIFLGMVVYKTKTMRKPINFLIVNMAISDLLYPVFQFSRIIAKLQTNSWMVSGPFGLVLCKMVSFFPEVSAAVSIQSLVLITVDRIGAVVYPLRSPVISAKRCSLFILASWILAMAIQSPFFIANELVQYPSARLECEPRWEKVFGNTSNFTDYIVANIITIYYMPLVLIALLYIIIVFKLNSQVIPGSVQSVSAEQQRLKRERNVLKMSIAIVFMFAICYLPVTIYYFFILFPRDLTILRSCGLAYFKSIAFWLARSYGAINPIICFIFSGNYRQGLKDLLSSSSVQRRIRRSEPPRVELVQYDTRL